MHDYNKIAAIVGEDKINALREAGVEIADKPSKPTTGLLGRWAKDPEGKDVLIVSDYVEFAGNIRVAYFNDRLCGGADITLFPLSSLTFPDSDRERTPETVTTEEEYAALPFGSIVAGIDEFPFIKVNDGTWVGVVNEHTNLDMAGVTRQVLREGWGE